jgi:hypothetical protein
MRHVELGECAYTGVDIVKELIEQNVARFTSPGRSFLHRDIARDDLPRADLVMCRDCFIHLPFAMALAALRNFKRAGITYLLTTTYPQKKRHWDTPPGGLHWINLCLPPFNFPAPLKLILEDPGACDAGDTYGDRSLGLWKFSDVTV